MKSVRAFIAGCAGTELTDDERRFFTEAQPWGLILFKRNVADPGQVAQLTALFRNTVGRADAPVLVDQEGGRVQRLASPHWPAYPAGSAYRDKGGAIAARLGARLIADDLRAVGITVDCAPVLDVGMPETHQAIGNRAYGTTPDDVAALGRAFAEGLLQGGVLPVMKHVPGHGRATVDSHVDLPTVGAPLELLQRTDFEPFRRLADLPMAMTAHVVYTAVDPGRPATTSHKAIADIIRGAIGFDGLLLSDDLSMEALTGTVAERAAAALAAGCDIALHCNGKLDEARAVADVVPPLTEAASARAARALSLIAYAPLPIGASERARFQDLIAA